MCQRGEIVAIQILDPGGQNPKTRPVVVVSKPDPEDPGPHVGVAVTTSIDNPCPDHQILLPWHPRGVGRSGLNKECVAKFDWRLQQTVRRVP